MTDTLLEQIKADREAWWRPVRTDAAWLARLREDYPENAHMSDDYLRDYYEGHQKFATTWDHIGDAYDEYEPLAERFLAYEARILRDAEQYDNLKKYAFQATNALTGLTVGGSEFFGSEAHGFFKADIPACTKNINWRIEQARKMGAAQARARDAETIKAAEALAIVAMNTQCATQEDADQLAAKVAAFRAAQEKNDG